MKRLLLVLFIFSFVTAFNFHPKNIIVTFIPDSSDNVEACVLVYKKDGESKKVPGVAEAGRYKFDVDVDNYQKATISFSVFNNGRKATKNRPFILEPGNVIIDNSSGAPIYSGTPFQDELNKFYKLAEEAWTKFFPGQNSVELNDPVVKEKYEKFLKEKNVMWEKYFESNKNPLITAFNLENYVTNDWVNLDKAEYFFSKLDDKIKALPDVKEFGEKLKNQSALRPGKQSPPFSLPDATGNIVSLDAFKGKYVLVDFWASWCKPCREESPVLVSAYAKYKDKGFDILSVSFDEENLYQKWLEAVKKDQYTWTNVIDVAGMSKSSVAKLYNVNMIPKNLLLDKTGKIVAVSLHGEDLLKELDKIFNNK